MILGFVALATPTEHQPTSEIVGAPAEAVSAFGALGVRIGRIHVQMGLGYRHPISPTVGPSKT
jgi:hypothetical protein